MPQSKTDPVFISYSRRDDAIMRRIVKYLRSQGINTWVDNEKLVPGTPVWENEIEKAIKGSFAIVVVLSPDAKNSEWVLREITLADQFQKRVFPVLVAGKNEDSIPFRLITRQFVDLRNNEKAGLVLLHNALSGYLNEVDSPQDEKKLEVVEKDVKKEASILEIEKAATFHSANQTLSWFTLAWAIGGLFSGFIYNSIDEEVVGDLVGGAVGGAIGGLVTVIALRNEKVLPNQKSISWATLGWAISGAIGWLIGWGLLTEAIGAGIGMAFFAIGGLVSTFGIRYIRSNWKNSARIILAWALGEAIGWLIARRWLIDSMGVDKATSWAFGTLIGWGIAGLVMGWQLLKKVSTR